MCGERERVEWSGGNMEEWERKGRDERREREGGVVGNAWDGGVGKG